jgi:hypothetical protein
MNTNNFMEGYKTYTGIAITLISSVVGLLGMNDIISNEDITTTISAIGTLVGTVLAIYGRYKAKVDLHSEKK